VSTDYVLRGPTVEIKQMRDETERWCFGCRKRLTGVHVLYDYPEPIYLSPVWAYRCDGCGKDRRQFGS